MGTELYRAPHAVVSSSLEILPDAEIAVDDGLILEVRRARTGAAAREFPGRILIPGLINAHLHSEFLLLKGLLEELRLDEWEASPFFKRSWSWIKDPERMETLRAVYRASYLQLLLGGTTLVVEFNCADAAVPVSVEVMREVGLNGLPTVDFNRHEGHEVVEALSGFYALDDERQLTEEELERASRRVRAEGARLTMHAAETRERAELVRERFGKTTLELLDSYGLLGPWMLLSHAVHLSEGDLDTVGRSGAAVVASPSAEMKLADGVAPLARLVERGVPVALGTDAAVCNNGSDMFIEMRTAALLQKLSEGAHALDARRILGMTTHEAARALNLAHERGSLEAGKAADIVAVDTTSLRMNPFIHNEARSNAVANLVYCATAADVTDVLVGGEPRVREGRHVRLDSTRVCRDLEGVARALGDHVGAS